MRRSAPSIALPVSTIVLVVALAAQVGFWSVSRTVLPEQTIVPPVPAREAVVALSLGDTQAGYRAIGLNLQNFGDTGGRWSALADYDYDRLAAWFDLSTSLDPKAWYVPALAASYYAQTPRPEDARRMVEKLVAFAAHDRAVRWRLLAHTVYLARHRVGDLDYALEIARMLAAVENDDMPFWPRQWPALILFEMGRTDEAAREFQALGARFPDMSEEEARYHAYFLESVLGIRDDAATEDRAPSAAGNP